MFIVFTLNADEYTTSTVACSLPLNPHSTAMKYRKNDVMCIVFGNMPHDTQSPEVYVYHDGVESG